MNTIPTTYSKNGWNYKLLKRTDKGAIYTQSKVQDLPLDGKPAAWEVVRIRVREEKTIKTTKDGQPSEYTIKAGEYLPHSEEWGSQGWTFVTLEGAEARLAEISTISETPNHKAEAP